MPSHPNDKQQAHGSPRSRDLFRAFALPFDKNKKICEALLCLFKDQEPLREFISVDQFAVLHSLYDIIHAYPDFNNFRIVDLTESANEYLRQKGEHGKLSEKRVGDLLTSLNLTDRKRTNVGYVLSLDRNIREQIHSMARQHGTEDGLTATTLQKCELCQIPSEPPTEHATTISSKAIKRADEGSPGEHRALGVHGKPRGRRKAARAAERARSRRL